MSDNNGGETVKVIAILSATSIVMFMLGIIGFLNFRNMSLTEIVPLLCFVAAPTVTALLGLARVGKQQEKLDTKMDSIHKEVNGKNHNLEDRITDLEKGGDK